jgi:hypothetical protein
MIKKMASKWNFLATISILGQPVEMQPVDDV